MIFLSRRSKNFFKKFFQWKMRHQQRIYFYHIKSDVLKITSLQTKKREKSGGKSFTFRRVSPSLKTYLNILCDQFNLLSRDSDNMEQFEQLLTCCVCLDRYRNPKLLPCQHSFCMEPCMDGECVNQVVRPRQNMSSTEIFIVRNGLADGRLWNNCVHIFVATGGGRLNKCSFTQSANKHEISRFDWLCETTS